MFPAVQSLSRRQGVNKEGTGTGEMVQGLKILLLLPRAWVWLRAHNTGGSQLPITSVSGTRHALTFPGHTCFAGARVYTHARRLNNTTPALSPPPDPLNISSLSAKHSFLLLALVFISVFEIWSCYIAQDGLTHYVHECHLKFGEIVLPLLHLGGFLFLFWWESLI